MITEPRPNTRVQRTRSSASRHRAPRTRQPGGRQIVSLAVLICWFLGSMWACKSSLPPAPEKPIAEQRVVPVEGSCSRLQAPKLIRRVEPKYPDYVRKQRLEGTVQVEGILGVDGKLSDITVKQSPSDVLSGLVIEAAKEWRYAPADCDGQPIRVYVTVTSTFRLNSK